MGEEKIWEKPWDTDQLKDYSTSWSLAADNGVKLYMFFFFLAFKKLMKILLVHKFYFTLINFVLAASKFETIFRKFNGKKYYN